MTRGAPVWILIASCPLLSAAEVPPALIEALRSQEVTNARFEVKTKEDGMLMGRRRDLVFLQDGEKMRCDEKSPIRQTTIYDGTKEMWFVTMGTTRSETRNPTLKSFLGPLDGWSRFDGRQVSEWLSQPGAVSKPTRDGWIVRSEISGRSAEIKIASSPTPRVTEATVRAKDTVRTIRTESWVSTNGTWYPSVLRERMQMLSDHSVLRDNVYRLRLTGVGVAKDSDFQAREPRGLIVQDFDSNKIYKVVGGGIRTELNTKPVAATKSSFQWLPYVLGGTLAVLVASLLLRLKKRPGGTTT